jgi:hypothetical protein
MTPQWGWVLYATPIALVGPLLGDLAHMNVACPNKKLEHVSQNLIAPKKQERKAQVGLQDSISQATPCRLHYRVSSQNVGGGPRFLCYKLGGHTTNIVGMI